jgi:redox-sensitive bicupin YhaK (pirin superfamily)
VRASQGRRYLWWNFVASTRERIEQARADWRQQRFAGIPGEHGSMAMPGEP